ncbi:MAG TPA: hypothetical protein VMB77_14335 [Syntrophales bacterium]|nr:hypothetical protein [Syntrophales bacterium]
MKPENVAQAVVSMIRQESEAGRLISSSEILHRLIDQCRPPLQAEEFENLLNFALDTHEDLIELVARDGSRYCYSSHFMTGTYAAILLRKQGDPLRLIAEVVRQNSSDYTRPVPLELFTQPPFDLPRQDVLNDLKRMDGLEEFRDIARTTTSAASVFLYSTRYLEPEHASMLAEWLDVGQSENP